MAGLSCNLGINIVGTYLTQEDAHERQDCSKIGHVAWTT